MEEKIKIIRYIIGSLLILGGIGGIAQGSIHGIICVLFGTSLFPGVYKKFNKSKKLQKVIPAILFVIFTISMGINNPNNIKKTSTSTLTEKGTAEKYQSIDINEIEFKDTNIQLDIKETKDIELKYKPQNAKNIDVDIVVSDEEVIKVDKIIEDGEVKIKIEPSKEGTCTIYAITEKKVKSNVVNIDVIDNDRIEREKAEAEQKAKEEQEAAERARQEQEAAEKARQEQQAREQAQKEEAAQQAATQQQSQSTTRRNSTTSSGSNSNYNGSMVYITPTGKKYHYSSACGGKNSWETTLSDAQSRGLTPCKKCVH